MGALPKPVNHDGYRTRVLVIPARCPSHIARLYLQGIWEIQRSACNLDPDGAGRQLRLRKIVGKAKDALPELCARVAETLAHNRPHG